MNIKNVIRRAMAVFPVTSKYLLAGELFYKYKLQFSESSRLKLYLNHYNTLLVIPRKGMDKENQLQKLFGQIEITPTENAAFFYSIDCFKKIEHLHRLFDNYTVDYSAVVNGSFQSILTTMEKDHSDLKKTAKVCIQSIKSYYDRILKDASISSKYETQLNAIGTLFERPAETFFEGLQRILFVNQLLWQTGHKNNGLGHLDWILFDLYESDIAAGKMTEEEAAEMLRQFMRVLHEYYCFKSSNLLGDTGQIIILGGKKTDGEYCCNTLTYKFIEASIALKLPDPKVLLRCSSQMPQELLALAMECIATGIGAPLLSNDDAVVPALIDFGYDAEDAYHYATSACWEPLILDCSCDQNNMWSINFAQPLVEMMESAEFDKLKTVEELLSCYRTHLQSYLCDALKNLAQIEFEEDPLLSLLSKSVRKSGKDIVRGGAKYSNMGLTSVGMSTVVNSILNMKRLVFAQHQFSLEELNSARKNNFKQNEPLRQMLKTCSPGYGSDDPEVIALTKQIISFASEEIEKHSTKLGGKFKFGLSSPSYLSDAKNTPATLDGRQNGEPFGVHISSASALAPTELLSFAMQLDYKGNRINGNVVDFFVTPNELKANKQKYMTLVRCAFAGGAYQMQINVVDSATLIAAKENPELFPDLVVRVWGFSAYFKDLPEEYKDLLISRALENEKAV